MSEAWRILKSVRKDEKYGTNMRLIGMKECEEHYKGLLIEDRLEFAVKIPQGEVEEAQQIETVTILEVKESLKKMKNGKAVGPCGIPIELVKYGPDVLIEKLTEVFNKCVLNGCRHP